MLLALFCSRFMKAKQHMKILRVICVSIVTFIILYITIISREPYNERIFKPLLWELRRHMWGDIIKNIALFIPFGFIIGRWKGAAIGFFFSCGVETTQYFTRLGFCELDDVLNNTIGALIGGYLNIRVGAAMLKRWDNIPKFMRIPEVKPYYDILYKKRFQLLLKRLFDFIMGVIVLIVTAIPMVVIAIWIKLDSPGSVFYRQERVTQYGKRFRIHKFRTMVSNADKIGTEVTVGNDSRITKAGTKLRHLRLDELPQVLDVIEGTMSFVGTRPEAVKYVDMYKPEYYATLLMPAGITSEASIRYKDEDKLMSSADDVDKVYVEKVLPAKMVWNLESVRRFSFLREILTMFRTVFAVLGKDYN